MWMGLWRLRRDHDRSYCGRLVRLMHEFESIDRFDIKGRGTVITTKTPCDFPRDWKGLKGEVVLIDGKKYRVLAIETYAVWVQWWAKGTPVGLLIREVEDA